MVRKPKGPDGPDGPGELIRFAVVRKEKLVHVLFNHPCEVLTMTPDQAKGLAMALLRLSAEIIKERG